MRKDFGKFALWTAIFATLFVWVSYSWQYMDGGVGMGEEITGLTAFASHLISFIAPCIPVFMKVTYWIAAIGAAVVFFIIIFISLRIVIRLIYKIILAIRKIKEIFRWLFVNLFTRQSLPFPVNIRGIFNSIRTYIVRIAKGEDEANTPVI